MRYSAFCACRGVSRFNFLYSKDVLHSQDVKRQAAVLQDDDAFAKHAIDFVYRASSLMASVGTCIWL